MEIHRHACDDCGKVFDCDGKGGEYEGEPADCPVDLCPTCDDCDPDCLADEYAIRRAVLTGEE